jgi:hypothetical protein
MGRVNVPMAAVYSSALPSLARDSQSLHCAHDRHRIPLFTAALCRNVAVGQFFRDFAMVHLTFQALDIFSAAAVELT